MPLLPPVPNPFAPSISNQGAWQTGLPKARKAAASNHSCDCGHDQDHQDTDNNKYGKKKLRRQNSTVSNLVGVCLLVLFSMSVTLFTFGIMYWIARFRTEADREQAWDRFARAQKLLRLRGDNNNKGKHSSWTDSLLVGEHVVTTEQAMALEQIKHVDLKSLSLPQVLDWFDRLRPRDPSKRLNFEIKNGITPLLRDWARRLDEYMLANTPGGIRWIRPSLLPPMNKNGEPELVASPGHRHDEEPSIFYKVKRGGDRQSFTWQHEWQQLQKEHDAITTTTKLLGPPVDYTKDSLYEYPPILSEPPAAAAGGYPATTTLGALMQRWPQNDDLDTGNKYHETLQHFNYSDPNERAMAQRFRDAKLPFKMYDIPDITRVTHLWTDDYVAKQFDEHGFFDTTTTIKADGVCQESPDHFFAFFVPPLWQATTMGLPPVRNNDFSFQEWSQHARYSDAKPLQADQPHYYWQAGTTKKERFQTQQTFITRDLNTTLGAPEENFFVFNIKEQKGIQCRFGERGVTAATHYDAGQNMIAMLTGAKRYILSPPKACSQLGLFTTRESPIFRHSLLNFAHLNYLDSNEVVDAEGQPMSTQEREWLRRASQAPALDTVLRAGQVLFLPSFWFHYIVSIQKSAQCNVRSGIVQEGTPEFGGFADIEQCGGSLA